MSTSTKKPEAAAADGGDRLRTRWEFNRPLVIACVAALAIVSAGGYLLYSQASDRLASSLKAKSEAAAVEGDWAAEAKWLRRYLKIVPNDRDSIIKIALAANKAVDLPPANRYDRVELARQSLNEAVSIALDSKSPDPRAEELQRSLILRLTQYGKRYTPEIIEKIIALNPEQDDSLMLRSFAIARCNSDKNPNRSDREDTQVKNAEGEVTQEGNDTAASETLSTANVWENLLEVPTAEVLWLAWQANPDDIEIASRLLEELRNATTQANTSNDTNETGEEKQQANPFDPEKATAVVVADLAKRAADGQAQWVLFSHEIVTAPESARKRLNQQFDERMLRLQNAYEALADIPEYQAREEKQGESMANGIPVLPSPEPARDDSPQWDYLLAVATISNEEIPEASPLPEAQIASLKNMERLCQYGDLAVPHEAITRIYNQYCEALIEQGGTSSDQVLKAFAKGIERLGDDSAPLQASRLSFLLNSSKLEQAAERIQELDELRARRAKLFTGAEEALSQEQRLKYRSELDSTIWNLLLFRGLLALQEKELDTAIRTLRLAVESQTQAPASSRVAAASNLGQAYSQKRLWDLAAIAFEKAVEIAAVDKDRYRLMAASAWSRCGNSEREMQILNALESRSLPLLITALRSSIAAELAKPPATREFKRLQNRADQIRQELDALEDSNADKTGLISELELLTLSMPEREDGSERASAAERVLTLAEKYPDNIQVLITATLAMAAAGNEDSADELLKKLSDKLGTDNFQYAATVARVESLRGNAGKATETLKTFAVAHPELAAETLTLASQIMLSENDRIMAHDLLVSIPEDRQTINSLYKLFELSLYLKQTTETETGSYTPERWTQRLRTLEGPSGTYWRLAEATSAIAESQSKDISDDKKLELLREATDLNDEIGQQRPRWAYNIALGGWIAAIRGNSVGAIPLLRRAISTGDKRTSTLLLLVSQLNAAGRFSEAEIELKRLDQLVTTSSVSTSLAISIAQRKGDYERSMALARQGAGDNPRAIESWLLLAQTAMLAAKATDEERARDILLAEAKNALDKAVVNSKGRELNVFRLKIQFQAAFFGDEGVRRELARTLESEVPEPGKSLFVARTYLQLKDPQSAIQVLERLRQITPNSPDMFLGLAEYYRYQRDDTKNIEMLEQALKRGPNRTDVRSRLALGLALRQSGTIPWQRIKELVGENEESAGSNELLHALILINKGDDARKQKASEILSKIRQSSQTNFDDATRMLAALETERWLTKQRSESPNNADIHLASARNLYTELTRRPKPSAMDLYKFGDLLLRADQTAELKVVADQLDRIAAGSVVSLDLRLRLAKKSGDQTEADRLAKEWADRAVASGSLMKSNAWGSVGQTLARLGFHDEALEWLAKAYEADRRFFRDYVIGLAREQRYLMATDICKKEFADGRNPEALALMVDIMVLAGKETTFPDDNEALIAAATEQNQNVPRIVESIATLRLSQQRYVDAVRLYEQAEKLAPDNVRILNNLAMALSEVPGREKEAIPKIERAIEIFGRSPELLDTKGLVLLRNNLPAEATAVLNEATGVSDDPRYRFHLIMSLLRQGNKKAAISNWAQLDLRQLRKLPLTPGELTDLESLEKEFGAST